jgi:hypothetical protein
MTAELPGSARGGADPGNNPTPPVRGGDGTRPGGVDPPAPPGRPIDAAQVLRDYERRNGASLTLDLRAALLAGADALDQVAAAGGLVGLAAEQLVGDLVAIIGHLGGEP